MSKKIRNFIKSDLHGRNWIRPPLAPCLVWYIVIPIFPNRSKAIQEAIEDKLNRLERTRLAEECAKLDPVAEQAMAEEGLSDPVQAAAADG